ncbi:hypothetical protein TSUD_296740 [Trifolium subterraneum]|uniref:Uncharacterized protein n=1 Tax=Trifolium subterraneum TaxID=3900 RepID=A0A2Z6PCV9_TRISU|nr:hypothetical protein TSUD_296740 [Trifolium subterraneum]
MLHLEIEASKLLFDGPSFDLGIEEEEISQPLFDGPSFDSGIEDMENNQQVKKTESSNEIEVASNEMNENHGLNLEIVEPYDRGFLDFNKFSDDALEFGFENKELNKEVHNVLKIFLD